MLNAIMVLYAVVVIGSGSMSSEMTYLAAKKEMPNMTHIVTNEMWDGYGYTNVWKPDSNWIQWQVRFVYDDMFEETEETVEWISSETVTTLKNQYGR